MDTKYISKPVWAVPTSISVPARPSLPRACKPPPGDGLFDDTSTESGSVNYSISQESNTVEDDPFETDDSITTEWRSVDTTPPSSPAYSPTSPAYSPPTDDSIIVRAGARSPPYEPTSPAYYPGQYDSKHPGYHSESSVTTTGTDPLYWDRTKLARAWRISERKLAVATEMLDHYDQAWKHMESNLLFRAHCTQRICENIRAEQIQYHKDLFEQASATNQHVMELQQDVETLQDAAHLLIHFSHSTNQSLARMD